MKSNRIKNWPKAERPRERLLAEGADKLTEAELLAIILRGKEDGSCLRAGLGRDRKGRASGADLYSHGG